ncbi:MAG: hypothetical protein ACLTD2_10875 [Ruminococcus sp.]
MERDRGYKYNLSAAMLAMKRAAGVDMGYKKPRRLPYRRETLDPEGLECPAIAVVKGDAKESRQWRRLRILAKVTKGGAGVLSQLPG